MCIFTYVIMDPMEIPLYVWGSLALTFFYSTLLSYTNTFRITFWFQTSFVEFRNCFFKLWMRRYYFQNFNLNFRWYFIMIYLVLYYSLRLNYYVRHFLCLETCILMFECLLVQFYFRGNLQLDMMGIQLELEGFFFYKIAHPFWFTVIIHV